MNVYAPERTEYELLDKIYAWFNERLDHRKQNRF
jgi:hypothetical protein